MKKYFFYMLGPIDWWEGWQKVGNYIVWSQKDKEDFGCNFDLDNFIARLVETIACFKKAGWEGDIRGDDLYVAGLPTDDCTAALMFALKQNNNGSTFVASPYRLPWLKEYEKK